MVHPVKLGENTRMSYGKINEVLEMPNLIEIQTNSYKWFLMARNAAPINPAFPDN